MIGGKTLLLFLVYGSYLLAGGIDKIRKIIIKIFKNLGFQLVIKTNLKQVEFLNITFNLITGLYTPYKKPNGNLLYINTSSDHPPQMIEQLTNSINKRLCENSANEQVFNAVKPVYENVLYKSGYKSSLKYSEEIHQQSSNKRTRKVIWFNPPFTQTVKTNGAKLFFRLLDKHVSTIRVSYICMNNVSQIIKQHNRNIFNKKRKNKLIHAIAEIKTSAL